MSRILVNLALLTMLCFTLPAMADNNIREYQLPNGLTLVVKPDHRAPIVLSEIWYKVGSSYEPDGITGISHVLEHMMFKGTPTYPPGTILTLVAAHGGTQNAMTGADFTMYYQEWAANNLDLSFTLEADRMQHLLLDPTLFNTELHVVQEERRLSIDNNPNMVTYERFNAALFPNSPYGHPDIGWPTDLKQLNVADLRHWYQTWYTPNNAILVVVGDVNANHVYELAEEHFGNIKPKMLPVNKQFTSLTKTTTILQTVHAPAKLPVIYMGFNVPSVPSEHNSQEPYTLDVINQLLTGDNSARLFKNVVRGATIATYVEGNYDLYARLPTVFAIAAQPTASHSNNELKQAILQQIQALQNTPPTQDELNRVKNAMLAMRIYNQDQLSDAAYMLGSLESVGLSAREIDNYQRQINKITPADIQAVAKKYLIPANMTVTILAPTAIAEPPTTAPSAQGDTHANS